MKTTCILLCLVMFCTISSISYAVQSECLTLHSKCKPLINQSSGIHYPVVIKLGPNHGIDTSVLDNHKTTDQTVVIKDHYRTEIEIIVFGWHLVLHN
jgi:hypothetical protein